MLATTPLEQLVFGFLDSGGVALFMVMLSGLLYCFFGYVLFRVLLAFWGLQAGAMLGYLLMVWRLGQPNVLDIFVGCGACAVLLALLSWFCCRLVFSASAGVAAWAMALQVLGGASSTGAWVLGVPAGLVLAVLALIYTRPIVIFLFGLFGGCAAVLCGGAAIAGGLGSLTAATVGPDRKIWLLLLLVLSGIVVSAAGMYSQSHLARLFRSAMAPGPGTGRKRRRGGTDVRPRFSQL